MPEFTVNPGQKVSISLRTPFNSSAPAGGTVIIWDRVCEAGATLEIRIDGEEKKA